MDTRTKEAVRYLGYGWHAVDDTTLALIENSFAELSQVANAKIVYRIFDLSWDLQQEEELVIGTMHIKSRNLMKNLKGCSQVVVLGATLGIGVDRLMRRYEVTDMAKAVVLQACAAALLEDYLDEQQEKIAQEMKREGTYLRPRFSPGYGDFSISCQRDILAMLDTAKTIGLTMTDAAMLTPVKSVTAVIGISKGEDFCHRKGCEVCQKSDCIYRRDER